MLSIQYASPADAAYVCSASGLAESEFERKVRDGQCYILRMGAERIGVMTYQLFLDSIPFLTHIHLEPLYQRKGLGKAGMTHWENELRVHGYKMCMVSTQADEEGQHFYRKLGYKDMGSIVMDIPPFIQPPEMFLGKAL